MIRIYIFLSAAVILAIGFMGHTQLGKDAGMAFLLGSLTLGGGLMICGVFTIKMLWHGIIGAGVLALLGLGRGILNFPDAAKYIVGQRDRGTAPVLELAVTLTCAFLLVRILGARNRERTRKMLENNE
ncbi:hypothetical protein ACFSSA_10430 [Luteolibacter algae]|uniref:Uncharacterized protein n=1 Tax=Luteolibacter algae TaxID=454151 RepID=A0ABW5DCH3_9BACT